LPPLLRRRPGELLTGVYDCSRCDGLVPLQFTYCRAESLPCRQVTYPKMVASEAFFDLNQTCLMERQGAGPQLQANERSTTNPLHRGGRRELAQQMAAHESPRTTALYDRGDDEVAVDEV